MNDDSNFTVGTFSSCLILTAMIFLMYSQCNNKATSVPKYSAGHTVKLTGFYRLCLGKILGFSPKNNTYLVSVGCPGLANFKEDIKDEEIKGLYNPDENEAYE